MNKFFEKQIWHFLGALLMLTVARYAVAAPGLLDGEFWSISARTWFWWGIWSAIGHQLYVMLVWRSQLHFAWVTRRFGERGFDLYGRGFGLWTLIRFGSLVGLALATPDTLTGSRTSLITLAALIIALVSYLMYSVLRYFSINRALGADHFEERYRSMGFEKRGIFRFVNNGMYIFGLLALWLPGILLASRAALIAGLLSHAYIWVHYFSTEKPDIAHIYSGQTLKK